MTGVLTDDEYAATAATLVRLAGLVFDASRRAALSAIINDRIELTGRVSVLDYLVWVESPAGLEERQQLLDAVTIQETHFYRNLPQVDALREEVLPGLVARARSANRPLTIWSAGCSTGEEPYTLAMLVLEIFQKVGPVPVRIIATDVSRSALAVARQGIYSGRTIELAEAGAVERWFKRQPDGAYSVGADVRELVEFQLNNLVTDEPPFGPGEIDLVVCRNVTIYFGRNTTQTLVNRFNRGLTEGGYLLLGHAETLWQISDAFSLIPVGEAFVYRKDAAPVRSRRHPPQLVSRSTPPPRSVPPKRGVRDVLRVPVRLPRWSPTPAAPTVDRTPSPLDDLASARIALGQGRYEEAASLAERATAAHPLLVEGYIVEGRALANQGDDDGAIAALRKAVFLDPRAAHAHFLLATTLSRVGDPAGAALSFAAAAETLPSASPETLAELLDGRAVSDLVDLCRQLAAAATPHQPDPVAAAAGLTDEAGWRTP
ncbi:MAG TPA: CheR family methyltransferase [Actinomycetes bacterium]|nr:CheR family methyltransferase [Actinomycetes bacterium]